jgi:hypothetical protein
MRKRLVWIAFVGTFTGCLPYPRFARVYLTPQYTGLFLDRNQHPVANVFVSFTSDAKHGVRTGADGRAVLPARRSFHVIGFWVMDPARPLATVRATWSSAAGTGVPGLMQHLHQVPYYPDQRHSTTVQDTVVLPFP